MKIGSSLIGETNRLEDLFSRISVIEDIELKSHWAKYLCVLVSGHIENSIRKILIEYSARCSNEYVLNFVEDQLSWETNMNTEKILKMMGYFNVGWTDSLKQEIDSNDKLKTSVDSIVANRHLIAHGKNIGMSFVNVNEYFKDVKKFIQIVEKIILHS